MNFCHLSQFLLILLQFIVIPSNKQFIMKNLSKIFIDLHYLKSFLLIIILLTGLDSVISQKKDAEEKELINSSLVSGLKFRSIGPALTSGRIIDLAVNENKPSEYFVAAASGGVWKTNNSGITYDPIFDGEGSYSIGCVTIDPNNSNVIWVGSGENNSQRSVSYGDGVYKSLDGGKSWKNMGLKSSQHIGKIVVDPRNSNHVYVAAQGPLWNPGGERGLFMTSDGGKTWTKILEISENTGVSDLVFDRRNPDVMFASSYQRRRHTWTLINGGPESAVYKTYDGGQNWEKISNGLPGGDLGRIGLAISPVNPDYVFALIEASGDKGGFFRSTDRGESWNKMNPYKTTSAQYYQEIFCDPFDADRLYSVDTWTQVTNDGGKTWQTLGNKHRHVDDHAFWADPVNKGHYLIGGDGGLYETFDSGVFWDFKENLPVTQFYRVAVDNDIPFYNVYGGTQDNNSLGGPSRTINMAGITNSDWFITNSGDGFESAIDPVDPNIVYAQSQHGYLTRFNKLTNEKVGIQPVEEQGEDAYRWNWNSPLIISPHNHNRLYFAANFLFRSDDQGSSWKKVSGDMSRQIDRNTLKVMGKIQSVDAVAKNASTSLYGNIVSLTESPVQEGIIYTGTDDGLINVTKDGGSEWTRIDKFKDVPEMTYVSCLLASRYSAQRVYASFDNRKQGDFLPYLLKSDDEGKTWTSIKGDLPENLPVHSIAEDHIIQDLLFIGTEFGVYFTVDGGKKWIKLKAGLPTICVKDIAIQERENDLVLGTFGRSFYVLDDYSPLRELSKENLDKEAHIFKIKDALMYVESSPLGGRGKGSQGENFFTTPNPPVAAIFTYYIKDEFQTRKQRRIKDEEKAVKENTDVRYPDWDELKAEDDEVNPYLFFIIYDEEGKVVTRFKEKASKGINRTEWDFRYPAITPARIVNPETGRYSYPDKGIYALPGKYFVSLSKVIDEVETELVPKQEFNVKTLKSEYTSDDDRKELLAFQKDLNKLRRVLQGANRITSDLDQKIKLIKVAVEQSPLADKSLWDEALKIEKEIKDIRETISGNDTKTSRNYDVPPTLYNRIESVIYSQWRTSGPPTETQKESYRVALKEFEPLYMKLKKIFEKEIPELELKLEKIEAPYTPGRFPEWDLD